MIKPQIDDAVKAMKNFRALAVVDSSGLFANASREIRSSINTESLNLRRGRPGPKVPPTTATTRVEFFPDSPSAMAALEADSVKQVVVIPADYLETGRLRRYVVSENMFNDESSERPVQRWLSRSLLAGRTDSVIADRALSSVRAMEVFRKQADGTWELKDDASELTDFLLPFIAAILLGMSIVIGGQYLLQGVSEEKESRILESMLCAVSPEDLVVGKLIGLGSAGLTLVVSWIAMGALASGPALLAIKLPVTPLMVVMMVVYFMLGYLFYASLMTGIGAMTNNLREANQFAFIFTFMNFIPFYMMTTLLGNPQAPLAVFLSLFPPTAPTSMILRMSARGAVIPPWQIGLSVLLLLGTAMLALKISAKVFRTGLLLYGKTPNLPEIIRWVRER
jgi:ABC-2 type transport system permease protein